MPLVDKRKNPKHKEIRFVSHYSAIGDTISWDAPYSAIGFRGKPFLRYLPPWLGLSLEIAIGHFY